MGGWEYGSCVDCVTVDPARATAPLENFVDLLKPKMSVGFGTILMNGCPPLCLTKPAQKDLGGRMCLVGEGVAKTHKPLVREAPAGGRLSEKSVDSKGRTHHPFTIARLAPNQSSWFWVRWNGLACQGEVGGVLSRHMWANLGSAATTARAALTRATWAATLTPRH